MKKIICKRLSVCARAKIYTLRIFTEYLYYHLLIVTLQVHENSNNFKLSINVNKTSRTQSCCSVSRVFQIEFCIHACWKTQLRDISVVMSLIWLVGWLENVNSRSLSTVYPQHWFFSVVAVVLLPMSRIDKCRKWTC